MKTAKKQKIACKNKKGSKVKSKNKEFSETLFIGGFPSKTTKENLVEYFKGYKSLSNISIILNDKNESRGFGYLTFKSRKDVRKAVKGVHKIFGKMFRVKKILSKDEIRLEKEKEIKRKIFLGGLSVATNEEKLEAFFSKFGEIEDILINRNMDTGKSKGCAFVLFKKVRVAQNLIKDHCLLEVDGNYIEVKKCYEKAKAKKNFPINPQFGMFHNFPNPKQQQNQGFNFMPNFDFQNCNFKTQFSPLNFLNPSNSGNFPMNMHHPFIPQQNIHPTHTELSSDISNGWKMQKNLTGGSLNSFDIDQHMKDHNVGSDGSSPREAFEKCPVAKVLIKDPKFIEKQENPENEDEEEGEQEQQNEGENQDVVLGEVDTNQVCKRGPSAAFLELLESLKITKLFHKLQNLKFNYYCLGAEHP